MQRDKLRQKINLTTNKNGLIAYCKFYDFPSFRKYFGFKYYDLKLLVWCWFKYILTKTRVNSVNLGVAI